MTKLYLVQHGLAKTKEEDPDRPLNEDGRAETAKMAQYLSGRVEIDHFLHSGKRRAEETVVIFKQFLNPDVEIRKIDNIGPMDDPNESLKIINELKGNIMIVGHLPHTAKLIGLLTTGNSEIQPVSVVNSAVTCLDKVSDQYQIEFYLKPDLLDN